MLYEYYTFDNFVISVVSQVSTFLRRIYEKIILIKQVVNCEVILYMNEQEKFIFIVGIIIAIVLLVVNSIFCKDDDIP